MDFKVKDFAIWIPQWYLAKIMNINAGMISDLCICKAITYVSILNDALVGSYMFQIFGEVAI